MQTFNQFTEQFRFLSAQNPASQNWPNSADTVTDNFRVVIASGIAK